MGGSTMPNFLKLALADVPDPTLARPPGGVRPARVRFGTPLTPRELEVLRAAALGMSTKEIAFSLQPPVTPTTVKNHFSAVFIRLGANDRAHAVAIGIREGYVDVGPSTMPRPDHLTADEVALVRKILAVYRLAAG